MQLSAEVPTFQDHLCGLEVRVSGYKSRGPWFDSRRYQVFLRSSGSGTASNYTVSTTEELLVRKRYRLRSRKPRTRRRNPSRCPRNYTDHAKVGTDVQIQWTFQRSICFHYSICSVFQPWRWKRCYSETTVYSQQTTRPYMSEESVLCNHLHEKLKPKV
jgi:hypothetical protein